MSKKHISLILIVGLMVFSALALTITQSYPSGDKVYGTDEYSGHININTDMESFCFGNDTNWDLLTNGSNMEFDWYNSRKQPYGNHTYSVACSNNVTAINPSVSLDLHGSNDGSYVGYDFNPAKIYNYPQNHGEKKNGVDCSNGYCEFDGVDDYAPISNEQKWNLISYNTTSISGWVKPSITPANYKIIHTGSGIGDGLNLYVRDGGSTADLAFNINNGTDYLTFFYGDIDWGNWNYVAVSYEANSNTALMCVNNLCSNQTDLTWSSLPLNYKGLSLSARYYGAGSYLFNGSMKNLYVSNEKRTTAQFQSQYNAGRNSPPLESDGLVLWQPMSTEAQNTTTVFDYSPFASMYNGNGMEFDGVDDALVIDEKRDFQFNQTDIAVALWFKKNEFGESQHLISKEDRGSDGWSIYNRYNSDAIWFVVNNAKTYSTTAITDKNWHSFVATVDYTNGESYVYIDGTEDSHYFLDVTLENISVSNSLTIGNSAYPSIGDFNGSLANIQIFENNVWTQTDVTAFHNVGMNAPPQTGDGLVLYLPLKNNLHNVSYLYDMNNYVADSSNITTGARFDGVDSKISLNTITLDLTSPIGSTISWKSKRNDIDNNGAVFGSSTTTFNQYIRQNAGNLIYSETNTNTDVFYGTGTDDTNWHSYIISCKNSFCNIYEDGINITTDGIVTNNITLNQIGQVGTNVQIFNGTIDNVIIWNRSLSAEEVALVQDWEYNPTSSLVEDLVMYKSFDFEDNFHDFGTGTSTLNDWFFINETCASPLTGDWNINISHNCNVQDDYDIYPNKLRVYGDAGTLTVNSTITYGSKAIEPDDIDGDFIIRRADNGVWAWKK